ncbi:MAG: hypothetical protein JOZ32_19565, partial [Bryobacterales bacterium]|nr:hypothetical protein [Bryobacterales bacterium]
MKLAFLLGIGVLGIVGIGSAVYLHASAPPEITIATTTSGLSSLKSNNVEYLLSGQFRVEDVLLVKPDGQTYNGSTSGSAAFDQAHRELTIAFPWGTVKSSYVAVNNRLTLTIATTNNSDADTIQAIHYTPLVLKFPDRVKEYDGSIPLLVHNLGQVAAYRVSYGSGTMAVASDDVAKPLMVGFPWALDKPANTEFPLSVHTDRVSSYPDSYPRIVRPIPPKASDQYVVSLRFGRSKTSKGALVGDLDKKFAQIFPQQLKWADRRPIGAIFLATGPQEWTTNPRGWFGDEKLNVSTAAGRAEFRQRILNLADGAIGIMRDMNAQGVITWDIEGQEFRHATTYIGDPRQLDSLAPEMGEVADEYFGRFRAAGLRTGICVRPQSLKIAADHKSASQTAVDDPTSLLIDKIAYAKKRWGVTLIYIDSNVNSKDPNPLDPSIIQKVATTFPDCLLIPEHSDLRYYAYSAPFAELRNGTVSTPEAMRDVYPKAFSLIYTADGPLDLYHDGLKMAVKNGDSLMYRT